jgi:hypothetical protein
VAGDNCFWSNGSANFPSTHGHNGRVTRFYRTDPLGLRVLAALASGGATASEVATRVGEREEKVELILERGVTERLVTRQDLDATPAYTLTTKGLEAVGVYQGVQEAVDGVGRVDLGAATRMVMEQYEAAGEVAATNALREQAPWPVDDASRDRVLAALNDAYARGALTKDQLDDRTVRALSGTTMGDVRVAGEGVIELPPALPSGLGASTAGHAPIGLQVNSALTEVRWRRVGYAGAMFVLGLFLLVFQPVLGLVVLLAGLALGGIAVRPLLRAGSVRITNCSQRPPSADAQGPRSNVRRPLKDHGGVRRSRPRVHSAQKPS